MTDRQTDPVPGTGQADALRRRLLIGGVASAATLAGLGLAWWNGDLTPADARKPEFWDLAFETPQSTQLSMQTFAGKPLLLNFWATWCPPCIEEMPLLDQFYAENSAHGWQVLGLAVDKLAAVIRFLERTPMRYPIALAGLAGADLSRSLGNKSGGLPYTVVFDASGKIAHRKIGRVTEEELRLWRASLR